MKFTKMQQMVKNEIDLNPKCADDDDLLVATIWGKKWDYNQNIYYNLTHLPKYKSILRRRQELQSAGIIKPSEAVIEDRYEKFQSDQHYRPVVIVPKAEYEAVSWLND